MPTPDMNEFDAIKDVVEKARGLSPASIRFVRARLLELLGKAKPDPHVAEAQAKTAELFGGRKE